MSYLERLFVFNNTIAKLMWLSAAVQLTHSSHDHVAHVLIPGN